MRIIFFIFCVFFPVYSMADFISAAKTHAQLGLIYLSKGFYARAKMELLLALQEDPNHALSWDSMAYFSEKIGDKQAASDDYQKALLLEPHSGAAKNNYGAFLCREKKYHEAIYFFLAAAKEPSYINAANAYSNAGLCAITMHDSGSAKKYFKMALLEDPRNGTALFYKSHLKIV